MANKWLSCRSVFRTILLVGMAVVAIVTVFCVTVLDHRSSVVGAMQTTDTHYFQTEV
jgi:hypothetical protein